ncbi:carbohydrate-binding domain-containing protein [Azospirillum sp. sgz302134]
MTTVVLKPGDSIQDAINANPTGTTFELQAGVYRGAHFTPKEGQSFVGDPGAVLNGSILLNSWQSSGSLWKQSGLPAPLAPAGVGANGSELPTLREDLFVNDTLYKRVGSLAEVKDGTWYYDKATQTAYMAHNPAGEKVEMSSTPTAIDGSAGNVTLKNLTVEKYASAAQTGAIQVGGSGWTVENVTARFNHGNGMSIGQGTTVTGGHYVDNGQVGIGAWKADNAQIIGIESARNNYANFDDLWDAGGLKITESTGVTVRDSFIHDNNGTGLWFDIDMAKVLVENNTIAENRGPGILYEISRDAVFRNNDLLLNGKTGQWLDAQVRIQNSSNVEVTGNHMEAADGAGGVALLHEYRGSGRFGERTTQNNSIHDNEIVNLGSNVLSGFQVNYQQDQAAGFNNTWNNDTWTVPSGSQARWMFNSSLMDWNSAHSVSGFESGGHLVVGSPGASAIAPPSGYEPVSGSTPAPTPTPAPEPTPVSTDGTTTIVVNAQGIAAAGVNAHFNLLVDGHTVGDAYAITTAKDYSFTTNVAGGQAHTIQIQYDNDAVINGQDRSLTVNKVTINGHAHAPTESVVTYDRGALDGKDVVAGQANLWWKGALVVSAPASDFGGSTGGSVPPAPAAGTSTIVMNAQGLAAGGTNAHFKLLVDGQKVGEGYAATGAKDYAFTANVTPGQAHKVQVQYDNDAVINGQDRSLTVNKITINGHAVAPTDGSVHYDKGALDGKDVVAGQPNLWWNGTLEVAADKSFFPGSSNGSSTGTASGVTSVTTSGRGPDTVTVQVAGDSYKGDPQFRILADGAVVGGPNSVTTHHGDGYQEFVLHTNLASTTKTVGIDFFNDYSDGPGLDRNLYVHSVEVNGHEFHPTNEVMLNNGIMHFDVTGIA